MTVRILRYVAARLLAGLAVLLGAATLAFVSMKLLPGDPVSVLLGPNTQASPQVRAQIIREYGFDQPIAVQYLRYVGRLATGDLGRSYQLQRPVAEVIGGQVGATAQLALAAVVLAGLLAAASATATAGRRPRLRALLSTVELVAVSTPTYWLGLLLLTVFSFRLRLFPVAGTGGFAALVLPAVALAVPIGGLLSLVLRDGIESALERPFVLTARARGLAERAVRTRHAVRHALLPVVTLAGWVTGTLLGGTVLVETVFARPGLGRLTLDAITSHDVPVLTGAVLLSAGVFVVINILVDVAYLAIDPRLRSTNE